MRKIYSPPAAGGSFFGTSSGSLMVTVCVFLVLPLSQIISSGAGKKNQIIEASIAEPPPPPPPVKPPEPPKPEPEKPKPDIQPETQQLSLSDLDLDLSGSGLGSLGGTGAGLAGAGGGLDDLALFDISDLDKPPVPVSQPPVRYPSQLEKDKISGNAVIIFILGENGRVIDPQIESATHPDFGTAALNAIKRWRFKPGMKAGKAVRSNVRQPFLFKAKK